VVAAIQAQAKSNKKQVHKKSSSAASAAAIEDIHELQHSNDSNSNDNNDSSTNLTASQRHAFSTENKALLLEVEFAIDDARETEHSALELAELVSMFESKVSEQEEQVEHLFLTVQNAKETLLKANDMLQTTKDNATSSSGIVQYFTLYVIIIATVLLFMLDQLSS